jgi:hypothetical protein
MILGGDSPIPQETIRSLLERGSMQPRDIEGLAGVSPEDRTHTAEHIAQVVDIDAMPDSVGPDTDLLAAAALSRVSL